MNLTQKPDMVTWPETHYVFLEKIGPFQNTAPQAWQNLHKLVPGISEHNTITGYTSLYQVGRSYIVRAFRLRRRRRICRKVLNPPCLKAVSTAVLF